MNDLVVGDPGVIPDVYRPRVAAMAKKLHAPVAERLGQRFLESARLVSRDVMPVRTWESDDHVRGLQPVVETLPRCRQARDRWIPANSARMSRYLLRRLVIAVPSIFGISIVLFAVLALAPGDPFEELASNPNVPPEVAAALRAKFGLDDPICAAVPALARRDAARRLGLFVRQPDGCRAR